MHVGSRACKRADMHVTNNNMIRQKILYFIGIKPLAVKNALSISVLCIAPFLQIILFQFAWWLPSILVHYPIYLDSSTTNFDKLKWEAVQQI